VRASAIALGALWVVFSSVASADPPSASELDKADLELRAAETSPSPGEKKAKAAIAAKHFESIYEEAASWRAAAGASDAHLLEDEIAVASAWYWLATAAADYSDAYMAWQKVAVAKVFEQRAAFSFDYDRKAVSLRIDGRAIPPRAMDRPIALELGQHAIVASAADGGTFQGTVQVTEPQLGGRFFFPVAFERVLKAGEVDPRDPVIGTRPKRDSGMSPLKIVTVVSTVALASAIAVGGGYLLFGRDNPHGLDTPEGAAIVITELAVIGIGTTIALVSD